MTSIDKFFKVVLLLVVLLNKLSIYAQPGTIDLSFNSGDSLKQLLFNGNVSASTIDGTDRVYISGSSSSAMMLKRVLPNGENDDTFEIGSGPNNYINAITLQSDGKLIITGDFTEYGGTITQKIARLNSDGSIDNSFQVGSGISGNIFGATVSSTGKIYVYGDFTTFHGVSKINLVRLNQNGTIDNTFLSSFPNSVSYQCVKTVREFVDNKILISGLFSEYQGVNTFNIAKLNSDGTIFSGFQTTQGVNDFINGTEITSSGIYVYGFFTTFGSNSTNRLLRLNNDGTLDNSFLTQFGINNTIYDLKNLTNNDIIVSGLFSTYQNFKAYGLVKLNQNGSRDTTYCPIIYGEIKNIQRFTNNTLFCGGQISSCNGVTRSGFAKFEINGTLNHEYNSNSGFTSYTNENYIYPDGRILICGRFLDYNDQPYKGMIRLFPNGSIDTTFYLPDSTLNANNAIFINDFKVQTDGKIIVVGDFTTIGNVNANRIVRLLDNGQIDNTFNLGTGFSSKVNSIEIQSDGKYLVGGNFYQYNGSNIAKICRLNSDGSIDLTFNPPSVNEVLNINLIAGEKIMVCGNYLRILNPNGTIDPTFNGYIHPLSGVIYDGLQLSDGKFIIIGRLNNMSTQYNINNIARLHPNGSVDNSFNYQNFVFNNTFFDIERDSFGRYIVAGEIEEYQNQPANSVIRLYENGTRDFNFNSGQYNSIYAKNLSFTNDNRIMVSGVYYSSPTIRNGAAILNANCYPTSFTTTIYGCDSVYNSITSEYYHTDTIIIDSLSFLDGCDSIIIKNFIITSPISIYDTLETCISYYWPVNGITYTSSGIYQFNTPGIYCDTLKNLVLTIQNTDTTIINQVSCGPFLWSQNGQTYNFSGLYDEVLTNVNGCDSVLLLNLTINDTFYDTIIEITCNSYLWPTNNQLYSSSGFYYDSLLSSSGCDSIYYLNLTIIPAVISQTNTFSSPSSSVSCTGQLAITTSGNPDFEMSIDGLAPFSSSGYSLQSNLCPGIHDLTVIDFCGDTVSQPFVIPIDSNYIFNNSFIDSIAVDSLGITITNCDIYYNSIDTAYIDSLWAIGNQVNVIWNIVDSNGSNIDTTTYDLMNGSGVYWLQLSVFCPTKAVDDYFTVTQAIYFGNGGAYLVGLEDNPELENSIGLYPNPTSNSVTITFESNSSAHIQLLDAQGKFIQERMIHSGEQISLEYLERGVYFLNVEMDGINTVKRIVKQ